MAGNSKYWVKDNISSILAIWWSIVVAVVFIIVLTKDIRSDDKLTYLIINTVGNFIVFILGYYFGSSKNSNAKQEEIGRETIVDNINQSTK